MKECVQKEGRWKSSYYSLRECRANNTKFHISLVTTHVYKTLQKKKQLHADNMIAVPDLQ